MNSLNKIKCFFVYNRILPRNDGYIEPSNCLNKIDDDLDNELHDNQKQVDFVPEKNFDILSITKKFHIDQNIKMDNRFLSVRVDIEFFKSSNTLLLPVLSKSHFKSVRQMTRPFFN